MKDILLSGIAGCGKGTQARELQKHLGNRLQYFEPGAILRALQSNCNMVGAYVKEYTSAGKLLPDPFMENLLGMIFVSLKEGNALLIDGFPRLYIQKDMLDTVLQKMKRSYVMFHLVVPEDIAHERLSHRLICPQCGTTYNTLVHGEITQCPIDATELLKRPDDASDASIRERFSLFHTETQRIIDGYAAGGHVIAIDGTQSIEAVTAEILSHLQ